MRRRDRDRAAARAQQRAHPARSQRGADHRVRHRLRDPQSDLDLQVHRHDTSGGRLPRGTGPTRRRLGARALPRGRTGPQPRCAGCGEPGLEAGSGGQRDLPGEPPGHLPRTSATRSLRACSSTRWLRPRSSARTSASRRWSMWCRSWRAWMSLANSSPGSSPGWTSTTTSARDTRCSDAACPIWTW